MTTNSYFVASDYDLTLRLQELFHQNVLLYTLIENSGNETAEARVDRFQLALKLKKANDELAQLVMEIKNLQSDTEVEIPTPQTLSASKRTNRIPHN
jgi:hypothetical protein